MNITKTPTKEMTIKELVAQYNALIEAGSPWAPVKKFKDKATAIKRVKQAIEDLPKPKPEESLIRTIGEGDDERFSPVRTARAVFNHLWPCERKEFIAKCTECGVNTGTAAKNWTVLKNKASKK